MRLWVHQKNTHLMFLFILWVLTLHTQPFTMTSKKIYVFCVAAAVLCMLYKIMCSPMHSINQGVQNLYYVHAAIYVDPWIVCASSGYTRCSGCTSVYLCASSVKYLAVPKWTQRSVLRLLLLLLLPLDFYSHLSVPLKRSYWPRIRWPGTDGFQEQCQWFFNGLKLLYPTIVFYYFSLSLLSVYRLVLWGWGLRTDRVLSLSLSLALQTSFSFDSYMCVWW